MQANPRTLDSLFNSQLRYVVPMFQRLYVWQENPQWATLWEDLQEKADFQIRGVQTNAHYLGALIIEGVKPSSPREVKRFLIIDGQQRLTTLQLVFCALRDIARSNDWKTIDRTCSRYLQNADQDVMEHPEVEKFKLWPTTLNRAFFDAIISAGSREAVELAYPRIKLPRKKKFEPRNGLVEAYLYFSEKISNWLEEKSVQAEKSADQCASLLLQALQQDFCVVEIALSEGDDSQEIFYSLNSQGRPLSQSDLLRSLIFMRAEKEKADRDEIFDEYWSKFETEFWSKEVKRGGRTYSRLDLALRYFLMAKTGQMVDARRVNEEYQRWITAPPPRYASVRDELRDFSRYGDIYQRYETPHGQSLPCTDLRRIMLDLDVSTALPIIQFLELEAGLATSEVSEGLFMLESFLVRRALAGEETKEYNKLFVELVGSVRNIRADEILGTLKQKLVSGGGSTRRWPTDEMVIDSAIGRPIYGAAATPVLRLILERVEVSLRTKKSEDAQPATGLWIEHVLPSSWSAEWPLQGRTIPPLVAQYPHLAQDDLSELQDLIRARNALVDTLGNLTLLNMYLNPAVGNRSFEQKKIEYKKSVLQLNRYFDDLQEWNEDSIKQRGKILGERICKIWPRPGG